MKEDTWMKCERKFFVETYAAKFDVPDRKLGKAIEAYNIFLQKALFGESPYIAEDLKLTILKARENSKDETEMSPEEDIDASK